MRRGEVWRVSFPSHRGHVQAGNRPAIILQNDQTSRSVPTLMVVPLTSRQSTLRFRGTVLVQPDTSNGLITPSVALVFQTQAIDRSEAIQKLGEVSQQVIDELMKALHDVVA